MEFRVGNIRAKCPGCGGTDFTPPPEEHSGPYMKYRCAGCGSAWTYARLIGQIGRETMRRKGSGSSSSGDRLSPEDDKLTRSLPHFLRRNT
jgi:transposase-like protein